MKKAVGIIITISMVMCSCMVAFGATTNSVYKTDTDTGTTAFSNTDEGDSKEVYGSYKLGGTIDKDGDGVPDTDTKTDNDSDGVDDAYTSDGSDDDSIPDGDGVADSFPDYDEDGDNDGDGDVDEEDISAGKDLANSDDFDDPDAISPEGATYSVDVVWGDMKYDFNVTGATWDSTQHKYVGGTQAWEGRYDGDKTADPNDLDSEEIRVTNHSNVAIRVRYKFTNKLKDAEGNEVNLTPTFTQPSMKLQHSVGKTPSTDVAVLSLEGDPGTANLKDTNLGSVTIKIDYTIVND